MRKALQGTQLVELSDSIVECETEYGVNAFFLAALIAHESSWGESDRARYQNNLTGYAVYNTSSKGKSFSSKESSIYTTADLLSTHYLSSSGDHYNGTSVYDVNTKYCLKEDMKTPDYGWSESIISIMNQLVNKANS